MAAPLRGRPGVVRALNIVNRGIVVVFYGAYALLLGWACVSRSVEAGSPRRRHRRGVRRSEFLPEAVQCAAALRVLLHRAAHCSRWRGQVVSEPAYLLGLRHCGKLVCGQRARCRRAAGRGRCARGLPRSRRRALSARRCCRAPSSALPRVRLLLFLRRCSKGLTWGLQPEGACALRKLMP